jgi:hypothetical protein
MAHCRRSNPALSSLFSEAFLCPAGPDTATMINRWLSHTPPRATRRRRSFVHVLGKGPAPLPLVCTHGWPSTFYELLPLVGLLTDPAGHGGDAADAFDLIMRMSRPPWDFGGGPCDQAAASSFVGVTSVAIV